MLRVLLSAVFVLVLSAAALFQSPSASAASAATLHLTAIHAKFEQSNAPFITGLDLTKACLGCHTEAGKEVTRSIHWIWETLNPTTGQTLGKKHGDHWRHPAPVAYLKAMTAGYEWVTVMNNEAAG